MSDISTPSQPAGASSQGAPGAAPVTATQPASQPTTSPGGNRSEQREERKAVPIPPAVEEAKKKEAKSRLPGVMDREDGDDLFPIRDPKSGRFLSREEREAAFEAELRGGSGDGHDHDGMPGEVGKPAAKEPAPSAAKPDAPPAAPPLPDQTPAQKVKFLGEEVTIAEIEQKHKTLQGMFKPLQERERQTAAERDAGNRAAWEWKERADAYEKELQQLRAGNQPQPTAGAQPGNQPANAEADPLAGIDFAAFEAIAVHPNGGLPQAAKYLAESILKQVPQLLAKEREQHLQPLLDERAHTQAVSAAAQVIGTVAALSNPDGSPAFPELKDVNTIQAIGEFWRQSGGDPREVVRNSNGLVRATLAYRAAKAMVQAGVPAATAAALATGQPEQTAQPAPPAAASVSADPAGNAPPNKGRSNLSPEAQRLASALERTQQGDADMRALGFARNKPGRVIGVAAH